MSHSAPLETHCIYISRPIWSDMLNLPEAKAVWNHPAKDPESESPGVKDPEIPATPSLLSRLVPRCFTWPLVETAEPEETEGLLDEESSESDDEDVFTDLVENIKRNIQRPESSMSDTSDNHEGDATFPIIIEPGSRSTLAARRHLQRLPRNVNVVSHSSSLHLRAPSSGNVTVFPGPQPLPSSAGVARTPVTANLRWQIEEQIQDEDLMQTIDAYAEEKVKRDRKHYTPRRRTPAIAFDFTLQAEKYKTPVASLRVRMLLVPAIFLLSQPNELKADEVEKALKYANSAQEVAWSEGVEEALAARCAYYIGLASFLLLPKYVQYVSNRPSSVGSFSERGKPETVQMYFKQACEAKGKFEEATWAEEWVEYLNSPEVQKQLSESAEEQRPTSANSWMAGWVKSLWGGNKSDQNSGGIKQPPKNILRGKRDSVSSQKTGSTFRPDGPERIPSFESRHTDDSRPSSSASMAPSMDEYEPPQGADEARSPNKRRSFTDDSDSDSRAPTLPPPVTSPKTSPTNRTSFAGSRMSPVLISPTSSDNETPISSPFERKHSRRTSLLSMVTGRERRPSEIEQAEEGDSPYRPKFDSVPETSEGLKKRKPSADEAKKRRESTEPEDLV